MEEARGCSDWLNARKREHEALHRSGHVLLDALLECRQRSGAGVGARFVEELATFRTLLLQHFAEEEAEEVFRTRGCQCTTVRHWIEATLDQHRQFEGRIDALVRTCTTECSASGPPVGIEREVQALLRDLLAHELSEQRLLQRAVFELEGGLDVVC